MSHDWVYSLHEGRDGTLWVGTGNGLNQLQGDSTADPASTSFTRYTDETTNFDGSAVMSILEDEKGMLWLGLFSGKLARFNPETGHVRLFGSRAGIEVVEFFQGAVRTREGTMYFGGQRGMIAFDPARSQENTQPPGLVLSELWLVNQVIEPGPEAPLQAPLSETTEVVLTYRQNDLSIGFVGLHYADPSGNRYNYRLVNYDEDWRGVTEQRRATYTSLRPGSYTFEVKAANSDGVWTEEPVRLSVVILPPWWRTWWAYLLYGLLVIGGVLAVGRFQRRRLIKQERERAAIEQAELRAEAAELQAQATEAQAKALQAENERQTQELDAARDLQLSMLPQTLPEHPTVELAAFMETATEVGGDYYDFNLAEDGTLTLAIGDATGHGMKAGTMVTATKSLFANMADEEDLVQVLEKSTRALKRMGLPKLYMALALGRLRDHTLELAGAGMPPALVYQAATQQVEEISLKGVPLGGPAFSYRKTCVALSPGDTVMLMSDGFPELFNDSREMLGYDRAVSIFAEVAHQSPEEIIEHFKASASTWMNGRAQDDDVTFVVMKVKASTGDQGAGAD